jgi:DNA-binding response OmpR family regulator
MPNLLLIEDNEHIQRIYTAKLQAEGFIVTTAQDGEQGLALAGACRPDAILLDIMLPKLDGFGVLEQLRADPALGRIPVYMLSNRGWNEDVQRAVSLGARQFFTKGSATLQNIVNQIRSECGFKKVIIVSPNLAAAKTLCQAIQHPRILCPSNTILSEAASAIERKAPELVILDARQASPAVLAVLQLLRTTPATQTVRIMAITDEPQKIQRADAFVSSAQATQGLLSVVLQELGLTEPAPPAAVEHVSAT